MRKTLIALNYGLTVISLSLIFSPLKSQTSFPFSIHNFTKQDYKAENQNWSITGDNRGNIYAANNIGLLEFDGIEWSFYPSPNGTVIRSVQVDGKNRIFTSGYRELGYWEKDQHGDLLYNSLNSIAEPWFYPNEEFWTTLIMDEKIYFHSFSSIFIYDGKAFKVIRPGEIINSIGKMNNKVLIHIANRGIYSVEDTVLIPFVNMPAIRDNIVRFMFMKDEANFLIGTSGDGIYLWNRGVLIPWLQDWKEYFIKNEINRACVTRDGNIIIGTILDGLIVFNREGRFIHHITNEDGLQNNTVLGIHNDLNNNTWLSLDRGIDFLTFQPDSSYTIIRNNEIGAVYSAALFEGKLYLGTNQGVFYRDWNDNKGEFRIIDGTPGQTWDCKVYDKQLFIGHNNGTFIITKNQAKKISVINGGFSFTANPRSPESIVQCTYSNIVFYKKDPSGWNFSYLLEGFNNLIRYIEIDHLHNIWASHMHRGVFFLKLNESQDSIIEERYYGAEIFGRDYNIQVFKIEQRVVFTTGSIIYTYDDINDTIIPYAQLNNAVGDYSSSQKIVPGPDHRYWFISKKGIALFKNENNSFTLIREYPIELFSDHLIIGYENIIPLSANSALLCLDNGYAVLEADKPDLSHLITDKEMIRKSIEISDAAGRTEKLNLVSRELRIPNKRNSLLIKYSFPRFSNEPISFQSFVSGIDTGWSVSSSLPEFSFKRLPPGEYTIFVKASSNWLKESKTDELKIIVAAPWYLQKISFLVYFLILLGSAFLLRRMLVSRFRERVQKIREAKEKELIRLRNEKLDSELSFKSQELANATMAIIKKNEFLLEIKEIIKAQKEELGLRYPDKYYQKLLRKIDANISSIDDWKIFETHFERAHDKFLQKLMSGFPELSPSDLRLCAYLRMNLSSKEIAPLLRISVRGVENHRYKLRKKLSLKPEENLIDFILGL